MKLLLIACLWAILLTCEGAPSDVLQKPTDVEYCPAPGVDDMPPSLQHPIEFSEEDFERAIEEASPELQETLADLEKDEDEEERRHYCAYPRQCIVVKSVKNYIPLPIHDTGDLCWLIQPVVWTVCEKGQVPNFKCSSCPNQDVLGFSCVQQYQRQAVWVYCIDGTISVRSVAIASGCSAMYYFCDPTKVPDCSW